MVHVETQRVKKDFFHFMSVQQRPVLIKVCYDFH